MSVDNAIYQLISSKSPITDLVDDRITPNIRQDKKVPAIIYEKVVSPRDYNFDGQHSLLEQTIDLHFYANTKGEVENLLSTTETEIEGMSGSFGDETIKQVRINSGGADDFLEDLELFTDSMEVKITFKR